MLNLESFSNQVSFQTLPRTLKGRSARRPLSKDE
jgi:hypothetical protein